MTETSRNPRLGLVQVYTGNGKGKTTAALGLALRACGHGLRTYVGQFLKGQAFGELTSASRLASCLTIDQYGSPGRFHPDALGPEDRKATHEGLEKARHALCDAHFDLVILDEIHVAISCGLLSEHDVLDLIDSKPVETELVLTGRNAPASILDRADLVSEVIEVRHPLSRGIQARPGIEY